MAARPGSVSFPLMSASVPARVGGYSHRRAAAVGVTAVLSLSKLVLAAAILALTLTASTSVPTEAASGLSPQGREVRLLVIGASLSAGYYASTPEHAYPELLAERLESQGWRVRLHVLARKGTTVRLADMWNLATPSDIVVVQLATNDYTRSIPLKRFVKGYSYVLRHVRAASPSAQLVCLGGWGDPRRVNRIGIAEARYNAAAAAACAGARGQFVDLSSVYLDPKDHGPVGRVTFLGHGDRFHPNDRGHELVAAAVLRRIHLPSKDEESYGTDVSSAVVSGRAGSCEIAGVTSETCPRSS